MKTIVTTSKAGEQLIANFLTEFLPTKEESKEIEKTYSLGFVRMSKLTKAKRQECFKCLYVEGFGSGIENQNELKRRLSEMSELEFIEFKKK